MKSRSYLVELVAAGLYDTLAFLGAGVLVLAACFAVASCVAPQTRHAASEPPHAPTAAPRVLALPDPATLDDDGLERLSDAEQAVRDLVAAGRQLRAPLWPEGHPRREEWEREVRARWEDAAARVRAAVSAAER